MHERHDANWPASIVRIFYKILMSEHASYEDVIFTENVALSLDDRKMY